MEDMSPRLPIALILIYKRSTHVKKKGRAVNQGEKPQRNNKKIEFKREIEDRQRRDRRNKLEISSCSFFLFSISL